MDFNRNTTDYAAPQAKTVDMGLRAYMLRIYNLMASGLALTGIVSLLASQSEAFLNAVYQMQDGYIVGMNGLGWVVAFAPLAAVFAMGFGQQKMNTSTLQLCFWGFAVLMGLSLSHIFLLYTGESIARTFFIVAGMFGAMSLWGYTTKKDLTGMGSFLMMGVIGILIAMIVNIFLQSAMMGFVISILGVLIFTGLTAYDTQKLKNMYYQIAGNGDMLARASIMGALNLYLDFINMFIFLLRLVGDRR